MWPSNVCSTQSWGRGVGVEMETVLVRFKKSHQKIQRGGGDAVCKAKAFSSEWCHRWLHRFRNSPAHREMRTQDYRWVMCQEPDPRHARATYPLQHSHCQKISFKKKKFSASLKLSLSFPRLHSTSLLPVLYRCPQDAHIRRGLKLLL